MGRRFTGRMGASLRRAPYPWLVGTIVVLVFAMQTIGWMFGSSARSALWTLVGVAYVGFATWYWSAFPRMVERNRRPNRASPDQIEWARWATGITPMFGAYLFVGCGAATWLAWVGLLVSGVLLTQHARRLAAERPDDA